MKYYIGLDVSLQETFICIMNQDGEVIKESSTLSEVDSISDYLINQKLIPSCNLNDSYSKYFENKNVKKL